VFGIPEYFATQVDHDVFDLTPIDPQDPPVFEAQATYLERLGLLQPGERERIPAEGFEPEIVAPELEEEA